MVDGEGGVIIRLKFKLQSGGSLNLKVADLGKSGGLKNNYLWQTSSMDDL